MIELIVVALGIVLVLLKWRYSKKKRQKEIDKSTRKEIKEIERALAKGDLDAVTIKFLELRRDVLLATAGFRNRGGGAGEDR